MKTLVAGICIAIAPLGSAQEDLGNRQRLSSSLFHPSRLN